MCIEPMVSDNFFESSSEIVDAKYPKYPSADTDRIITNIKDFINQLFGLIKYVSIFINSLMLILKNVQIISLNRAL